ncbi:hypothetical protein [Streptomyces sp. 2A115]|uniref:hypothetical protein n=1 Tax=Streptomyces sp. 2A115 TaxID=3457439 RepID=UPI003FD63ADE
MTSTYALVSLTQWSLGIRQQAGVSLLVALHNVALHGTLRVLGRAVALSLVEPVLTSACCPSSNRRPRPLITSRPLATTHRPSGADPLPADLCLRSHLRKPT